MGALGIMPPSLPAMVDVVLCAEELRSGTLRCWEYGCAEKTCDPHLCSWRLVTKSDASCVKVEARGVTEESEKSFADPLEQC